MPYKNKIIFIILICFIITLVLHGISNYSENKKNNLEQTKINLRMSSNALTDYIDLWMESKKGGLEIVARHLARLQEMDKEQIQEILKDTTKTLDGVDTTIGLEDGTAFTGTGKPLPKGYDPRIRPWYKLFKATGKVNVTDAYVDPITQLICVSVAAPIYKDGIFLGGIVLDLSLDFLTKTTSDVNFKGGYGILLDSQKIIIAHPNQNIHAKPLQEVFPDIFSKINQENGVIEYSFNNVKHLFVYKVSKETGWIPAIIYNKEESYQLLNQQIKETLVITLGILIVCIIITSIFMKKNFSINFHFFKITKNIHNQVQYTNSDLLANIHSNSFKMAELTKEIIENNLEKDNVINQLSLLNNKIQSDIKHLIL